MDMKQKGKQIWEFCWSFRDVLCCEVSKNIRAVYCAKSVLQMFFLTSELYNIVYYAHLTVSSGYRWYVTKEASIGIRDKELCIYRIVEVKRVQCEGAFDKSMHIYFNKGKDTCL